MIRFWKTASKNSGVESVGQWIILFLCLFAIVTAFGLFEIHHGFDLGLLASEQMKSEPVLTPDPIEFSDHAGIRSYEYLANKYWSTLFSLLIALASKLVSKAVSFERSTAKLISDIVFVISCGTAFYIIWDLIGMKTLQLNETFWTSPLANLAKNSIPYDWILFVNVAVAFSAQIFSVALQILAVARHRKNAGE